MILTGALVGLINGWAVAVLRMPAFIVTLTTMMFVGGLAVWLTKSKNIGALPATFTGLGNQLWLALLLTMLVALGGRKRPPTGRPTCTRKTERPSN